MLRLRPYKACDAQTITKWLKDEYSFRQWSADRYNQYPITPSDMNSYYDRDENNDRTWCMTVFDETGIKGHITMRFPKENSIDEIRFGFVIVDDKERGKGITPVYQKCINTSHAVDKHEWDEMIAYAKALDIPEEQCDFLPEDFDGQDYS